MGRIFYLNLKEYVKYLYRKYLEDVSTIAPVLKELAAGRMHGNFLHP